MPGAGPRAGGGGAHRQRQDNADPAAHALLRSSGWRGAPGRCGPAGGPPRGGARARIGLVTQEVQLFDASVRDNLTLFDDGVPDDPISAVLDTLRLAGWLRQLPRGLDTPPGPGGAGLSARQAQGLPRARI